jgi:L-ribulose-5-phosphate 4-epimerase
MLEGPREEVWKLNLELPKHNLVVWTSGNVSARDFESGLVVMKPSGVRYEELTPHDLVIVDLGPRWASGGRRS